MKIRDATPGDAAVITDFNIKLAFETEALKLNFDTINAGVRAILGDRSKGLYFVVESPHGDVAGQIMITYEWSDWRNGTIWWLQSVYVKEEFRGRGYFAALFGHVAKLARQSGDVCCIRLYMEKENARARAAYRKMGMAEMRYEVMELEL